MKLRGKNTGRCFQPSAEMRAVDEQARGDPWLPQPRVKCTSQVPRVLVGLYPVHGFEERRSALPPQSREGSTSFWARSTRHCTKRRPPLSPQCTWGLWRMTWTWAVEVSVIPCLCGYVYARVQRPFFPFRAFFATRCCPDGR